MTDTLSPAEVGLLLGITPATVVGHLRAGTIAGGFQPVAKGKWRIRRDVFEAWMDERMAAVDVHRIEPRSARSKAAQTRARRSA